jgi:hypothetical protein
MLREVTVNSAQEANTDNSSMIKLAQRRNQYKTMAGVSAVIVMMAACLFIITLTYRYAPTVAKRPLVLEEIADKDLPDNNADAETATVSDSSIGTSNSPAAAVTTVASTTPAMLTESELQYRLENYYTIMQTKDASQLSAYYAPNLIRFFNEYGVSDELLVLLLNQAWERTPEAKYEILWETFRYSRDEKGNYVVDYYMNYHYRRANRKTWKTQKIYTMMKMDKDLKIYYITGD